MEDLYYSALDIAAIISSMRLGCQAESTFIDLIWQEEKVFLAPLYRKDKKKFILDVRYWLNYLYEKPALDAEIPAIQKDIEDSKGIIQAESYMSDFKNLDLFFKSVRIRILHPDQRDYVRIKLRTLLSQYGYKRRSSSLINHFNHCLYFYHLNITIRGGVSCSITDVGLDQMIMFRVL